MQVNFLLPSHPLINPEPFADGKFWDFTSDLAKGDTAYTTLALGAHTDNTYFVRLFFTEPLSQTQT